MTTQPLEIAPGLKAFNLDVPTPRDYSEESRETMSDLSNSEPEVEDSTDREEGEISEEEKVQSLNKSTTRNRDRHGRMADKRHYKREDKAQKLAEAQQQLKSVLAGIYKCQVHEMHIHTVQPRMGALNILQDRENAKLAPLSRSDIDELVPSTVWIYEPGIHLGFLSESDQATLTLVFAVKIRSWEEMSPPTKAEVQDCLQIVMDIGDNSYAIRNNAAAKHSTPTSGPTTHGSRGEQPPPMTEPHGVMFGIGWHLSQELGRSLVNYAPRNKDDESLDIYLQLNAKLPRVSALYRHGLACLFPGGGIEMQGVADREGVASFADALDGVAPERPFANSLTATRSGFCNYQHCDKDFSIAYGMWWEVNNTSGKWTFTSNADHNKTSGGEFMWGAYGIGVDFARARGLIEIFWRGQLDFHGTLNSTDVEGYTRFGTSIQITRKGVNAMQKVWNVDELAQCGHNVHELNPKFRKRITTAQDRVDKARKDMASKRRKTKS